MQRRLVTANAYFSYFLIGFVSVLFAPALPAMIKDFHLSLAQAGLIFPARSLGTIAAVLVGGAWSDRVGRKPTIATGAVLFALGSLGVAVGQTWLLVLIAFLLSSVGQGFVNSSVNALVADLYPQRRGSALNFLHGVYSLGAVVGPLVASGLVLANQGWRPVFLLSGLLWAASSIFTLVLAFPPASRPAGTGARAPKVAWGGLLFCGLWAVAFLYNGTSWGLIGWINTYLDQRADIMSVALAARMVPLFYVALAAGRFTWSAVADRLKYGGAAADPGRGYGLVILICAVGPTIAYPLVIWSADPWLVTTGVLMSGLFLSGLYPTALAYATQRQPRLTGTISGSMSVAMSAGNMVVPWITGILADRTDFQTGMTFIYALVVVMLGVAVAVSRMGAVAPGQRGKGAAA